MRKRIYAAFMCAVIVMLTCVNVFCSYPDIDVEKQVSLTVKYSSNNEPLQWEDVRIYKVAEVSPVVSYTPTEKFAPYADQFSFDMRRDSGRSLALTLTSIVDVNEIPADFQGSADESGELKFSDLYKTGLYLVDSKTYRIGNYKYEAEPFLVCLPDAKLKDGVMNSGDDGENEWEWEYDVTAFPKINGSETDPPPTDPPVTDPPVTDPPPVTNPPVTNPPVTNPPVTNPPVTNPPPTNPPVTNPPPTNPPKTDSPATNPPTTNPPPTSTPGSSHKTTPSGKYTSLSVVKIWKDQGNEDKRPTSITVQLLRDGKPYDSVKLSKANNWKYTWKSLPDSYTWSVAEKDVPDGYILSIDKSGTAYSITNTYPDVKGDTHGTPSPRKTPNPNGTPDPNDPYATPNPDDPNITPDPNSPDNPDGNPDSTPGPEGNDPGGNNPGGNNPGGNNPGGHNPGGHNPDETNSSGNDPGNPDSSTSVNTDSDSFSELNDGDPNVPSVPASDESSASDNPANASGQSEKSGETQKLPQTGQLWWPVPIAAILGMALFIIGYGRARKAEEDE